MNLSLYALTVVLWGSSWIAIKLQLGVVPPGVSVVYRFVIAALVMMAFCWARRLPMRFGRTDHLFMAMQGLFLFSMNYFFIYVGTQYLASGLVAVTFSTVVLMNIVGAAVLFRTPFPANVLGGSLFGLAGIILVFWPEVRGFDSGTDGTRGLVLCLIGTACASAGMLTSAWNQSRRGLPVIQTNAWGMVYGTGVITVLTVLRGSEFVFDASPAYVLSLLWLAVFATVVGFWSYLTLVGRIGADRAAYATVLFPVIALALSTVFEGYQWTVLAAAGVGLVLVGNALVLGKPTRR